MVEMPYLDMYHIPSGTLEGGIALANDLYWNISIVESKQQWFVLGGEKVIFKTDSHEALEAFLYGMGLAYGAIPEQAFQNLCEEVRRLVE